MREIAKPRLTPRIVLGLSLIFLVTEGLEFAGFMMAATSAILSGAVVSATLMGVNITGYWDMIMVSGALIGFSLVVAGIRRIQRAKETAAYAELIRLTSDGLERPEKEDMA